MKKLPVGIDDFKELIEEGYYFVDKSLFVKGILEEGSKVKAFVFFRGRSIVFKEQGEIILLRLAQELEEYGKVEQLPKLEGKKIYLTGVFNPLIRLFLGKKTILNKIFGNYYYHQDMSLHDRFEYNLVDFKTSLKNINKFNNKSE